MFHFFMLNIVQNILSLFWSFINIKHSNQFLLILKSSLTFSFYHYHLTIMKIELLSSINVYYAHNAARKNSTIIRGMCARIKSQLCQPIKTRAQKVSENKTIIYNCWAEFPSIWSLIKKSLALLLARAEIIVW